MSTIKDKNRRDKTEEKEVKERWKEYTQQLYKQEVFMKEKFKYVKQTEAKEPNILESEVQKALQSINNNKSPGSDNTPIEMIKATGEKGIRILTALCNAIWDKGTWPVGWKKSVFIPIPKSGDLKDCANYRTIALISHTSKVLLKVLLSRLQQYVERELPDLQAGFRQHRGTRDHISNLRRIMERSREYNQDVFLCFIDYKKAFDCVDHELMWITLQEMGFPEHLIDLLKELHRVRSHSTN